MSYNVNLKKVTADNWEAVVDLEIGAGQENKVASTSIWLPRRSSIPTRAVYAGKRIIGFLIYICRKKDKAQEASIYRFMIDRKHQVKGYGHAALSKALKEIRAIPRMNRISIRYIPENLVAKPFYTIFSFMKTGRDHDDKVIAVLKL